MSIFDLDRVKLQALVNESMAIQMPTPGISHLRDEMLEFLLRLWEIKQLAAEAIEKHTQVDPARLIELLDGKR